MQSNGYEIFKSVIPSEECEILMKKIKEYSTPHMAHSELMWNLRTDRRIKSIFERLWQTDDLIVGFDGVNHRSENEDGLVLPWHVDQDESHPDGVQCYQSILAIQESNKITGSISVLPKSHLHHKALANRLGNGSGGWEYLEIPEDDIIFKQCLAPVVPSLERGDLFVWDSRTAHCVLPPEDKNSTRIVAYFSYVPRYFCTPEVCQNRLRAFTEGIATTHWPHRFVDRGDARCNGQSLINIDRLKLI
jgi:ectoine hydroxylase-related dioxygenase (phytanoyl-CoA dioxygenase family)